VPAEFLRVVGRGVVADHQFIVAELLLQDALIAFGNIARYCKWNANADFGMLIYPKGCISQPRVAVLGYPG